MGRPTRSLFDFLFPPRCVGCGEVLTRTAESRALCDACLEKFRAEEDVGCTACGTVYAECRCRPEGFLPDEFVFALPYDRQDGVCRKMILSCKNRKNRAVMEEIASLAVSAAEKRGILGSDLLLTYVPRSPEKELHTGVDQAEELAKAIAARTGLPLCRLLGHRFFTKEQKKRAGEERSSVDGVYYLLPGGETVAGRTVLLVDDVVTSGATVNACTVCLKEAGAARVLCLAAARSIAHHRIRHLK